MCTHNLLWGKNSKKKSSGRSSAYSSYLRRSSYKKNLPLEKKAFLKSFITVIAS